MQKDSNAKPILKAIAKALKTGVPVSVLAMGLSSCGGDSEGFRTAGLVPRPVGTMPYKKVAENNPASPSNQQKPAGQTGDKPAEAPAANTTAPVPPPPPPPPPPKDLPRAAGIPPAIPVKPADNK